ncbi:hypothetical protein [Paenibacillus lautus]|uniref:hypothetical protein n=1 Tax=Paenibacillus lautus TaxID=1401 RepID=UPI002DBE0077|nr:hypothetical protein [Paenibacillus lautus]MEC0259644.1 hypothetical protein [Paenibacillus lautus]
MSYRSKNRERIREIRELVSVNSSGAAARRTKLVKQCWRARWDELPTRRYSRRGDAAMLATLRLPT